MPPTSTSRRAIRIQKRSLAPIPIPDPLAKRVRKPLSGTVPSAANPPSGCNFRTRCPYAQELCALEEPPLTEIAGGRSVACHFADELDLTGFSRGETKDLPVYSTPLENDA